MNDQLKDLRSIFASRIFEVPDYERGYAWTEHHRRDLLNDLRDLATLDAAKRHFTGTLVLHRGRHPSRRALGRTLDVVDIVDGQQRLTTLVVLLSVIVRRLRALGSDDALGLARDLTETYLALQGTPRLTPHGDTAEFFRDHILGELTNPAPRSPPARALLAARAEFEDFLDRTLAGLDDAAKYTSLDDLATLLQTRLGFVLFEVDDEADVGVMFEVMNARGKRLTQFELVKNYLLFAGAKVCSGEALQGLTRTVNQTWSEVVRALDEAGLSADDDTLLRYHWYIWPNAKGLDGESLWKTHELHRAVKTTIPVSDGEAAVVARVQAYANDLKVAARAFAALMKPRLPSAFAFAGAQREVLLEAARRVDRMGRRAVVMPMLMASVLTFGGDPTALAEILRLTEVFVFRLLLRGMKSNTGESSLMQLAWQIRSARLTAAAVQAQLKGLIGYYAPDASVRQALQVRDGSTPEGNFYERSVLPHLLYEYERELVTRKGLKFMVDWGAFYRSWRDSTEHILPQGERCLTDPYWKARFTADAHRRNRHRLGNLVLTSWNSHYSDHDFDRKCGPVGAASTERVYRNGYESERELAMEPSWDEAAIDRRQQRIADFAMRRWAV